MRLNLFIAQSKHNARLGVGRRLLRVLGPSWASAPVRRGIQTLSLAAFLALLLYVSMPAGGARTADELAARERVEAESFLRLDPLVAVAAAVAGRSWVPALIWVAVLLGVCLVLPRMFCGYVCPMGTMIDLFDWAIGGRLKFLHLRRRGWWVHLRFVLLGAVLLAAACGWLVAGYVAAIPVVTRGLAFAIGPLRSAMAGTPRPGTWSLEHGLGVGVLAAVLVLGVLGGRFWCRCVCPSGAMLSVWSLLRLTGRHVTSACVSCGNCRKACSFDAIKDDYSTRATACTFCQDCGGVCPVGAIEFTGRLAGPDEKPASGVPASGPVLTRRVVLAGGLSAAAVGLGAGTRLLWRGPGAKVIRPPGALGEDRFLDTCVRCGQCIHACPTGLLGPVGPSGGLTGLWTPRARTELAACDPTCNVCGQVCPTGAIRPLPLSEKCEVKMGLATVDRAACLSWRGEGCGLCVITCREAGYQALVEDVELDEMGMPIEGAAPAPVVLPDRCVGCGLCQQTCRKENVQARKLLTAEAIKVQPLTRQSARVSGKPSQSQLTNDQ